MAKYNIGQKVFIFENARFVKEVIITQCSGGFYTVKYLNSKGDFRVRESRLYSTELEAQNSLRKQEE